MSISSIAVFVTIRKSNYDTVVDRLQNRWPGQTVNGFRHYAFNIGEIVSTRDGGQSALQVDFVLTPGLLKTITDGVDQGYLMDIQVNTFTPASNDAPPSRYQTTTTFNGEITSVTASAAGITVSVGSSLDPVEAQAPPRKYTSVLVGQPPQL